MSSEKIQEMQLLEQGLHNVFAQKQAFQMELSETQTALSEVKSSGEEVYKIVGQLMIKSEKSKIEEDLKNKEKLLDLRLKSLEKQESTITDKLESIRSELMKDQDKKKGK